MEVGKGLKSNSSKKNHLFHKVFNSKEIGILIPLVAMVIVIGFINPVLYSFENIMNVLRTTSFIFIIGIAMTFVLVSAGLDLSVGSVLALGGVVTGMLLKAGLPIVVCIVLGILFGGFVGILNGFIIVRFKIPPLIVTLGMMYIAQGAVLVLTKGSPVYPLPKSFNIIGQGQVLGIPYVVMIALVLGIIANIVLKQTAFGRAVYAVGGNEETSRLSGINIKRIKMTVYILAGAAASLSGILMASRLASSQPSAGAGYEMQVIAACIIGGTSMFGGSGSILGTWIGALFMSVVANGMVLAKVSVYWQKIIIGAIIVIAVGVDQYKRKKSGIHSA